MITLYPCQNHLNGFSFGQKIQIFSWFLSLPSKPALWHCRWETPATEEPVSEAAGGQQCFSRRICYGHDGKWQMSECLFLGI